METTTKTKITVETIIQAPVQKVWNYWTDPKHITQWYHASDDWHAPHAENNLQNGGAFTTTMAAKDGSFSFDFAGVYDKVEELKNINYTLNDGRRVTIDFTGGDDTTTVKQTFEAEETHSEEMQKTGWQAILDNFKKYVETN